MEAFYTLQGEGKHSGRAAYFVRIAGCDVGCVWCDVKDSWPAEAHPLQKLGDIVAGALEHPSRFLVITGGEPALYDLRPLLAEFKKQNFECAIETSGCYPLLGEVDWYCFSPKKIQSPLRGGLYQGKRAQGGHCSSLRLGLGRGPRRQGKPKLCTLPASRVVKKGTIVARTHRVYQGAPAVAHFFADAQIHGNSLA